MADAGDGFPYRERQAAPTARTLSPSRIIGGHTVPCTWASAAMATARMAEATPMISWVNADSSGQLLRPGVLHEEGRLGDADRVVGQGGQQDEDGVDER